MTSRLILTALLACTTPLASPAQTGSSPPPMARCELGNVNGETYKGPCVFTLGAKGSFSVSRPGNARIIEDDVIVMVEVTRPGVANVTSRTRAGTMLHWGRATRARTSPACWRGTDFWICVYSG